MILLFQALGDGFTESIDTGKLKNEHRGLDE
jgi:hypothetical protein